MEIQTVPVFRKKLIVLGFRPFHAAAPFPADIRGADRPGQCALPLVDPSEFGDLKFCTGMPSDGSPERE